MNQGCKSDLLCKHGWCRAVDASGSFHISPVSPNKMSTVPEGAVFPTEMLSKEVRDFPRGTKLNSMSTKDPRETTRAENQAAEAVRVSSVWLDLPKDRTQCRTY